ncbi:MAG TPA: NADH-quinone oxidoreductase subunit C [Gammaproteobacteria bacterium]
MSAFDWLPELLARLQAEHVLVRAHTASGRAQLLTLDAEDWGRAAAAAAQSALRWAGAWSDHIADSIEDSLQLTACLRRQGDVLLLRTRVSVTAPVLPSHTPHFPGADRMERHIQDLTGVVFSDHPDPRRWARHHAWGENEYPLRSDFPLMGTRSARPPRSDDNYRFLQVQGAGVYEIPVGPVHAGIIEPGHFRFSAVGEEVLHLEERLGYAHKGIEKIAVGRDAAAAARLAGRVSGDSTVAFAWAACMAMEQAAGPDKIVVPPRALHLRAIMAERERIANHLGDIGAICNDVGFAFAFYQFGRLREAWQRSSHAGFGHRLMMDCVTPGGVRTDPDTASVAKLRADLEPLRRELNELLPILFDYPSLEDRLVTTGFLSERIARLLGATGYVAKASNCDLDARRDLAYAPYDRLTVKVPVYADGDVMTRLRVRADEILISLDLLGELLNTLPDGPVRAEWSQPVADSEGLGIVEGWRGETLVYARFGADGRIARLFPRDPSWFTWPALEQLIHGNIVPDFPVCNKSVNGSYSGHDL